MNYNQLTASFISIIQAVSLGKETIGASMTIQEMMDHYLDELDFELAVVCFEVENRVLFLDEHLAPEELARLTLRAVIERCCTDSHPDLTDALFATKRFLTFKEALLTALRSDAEEGEDSP